MILCVRIVMEISKLKRLMARLMNQSSHDSRVMRYSHDSKIIMFFDIFHNSTIN